MTIWSLCTDCHEAVNFTDDDLGVVSGTVFRHQKVMMSRNPGLRDTDLYYRGEEHDVTFATSLCDGCPTFLAGARYSYITAD